MPEGLLVGNRAGRNRHILVMSPDPKSKEKKRPTNRPYRIRP